MPTLFSRRDFLATSGSCTAHLACAGFAAPPLLREWWARTPRGTVVATEPFGRLERVADGVWALISTPLGGDRTTLSNGGLVAGRNAVLAIEGFNQPEGAAWLAARAKELTGRWPTHVVLTHYHADHANGVAGYVDARPEIVTLRATATTRDQVQARNLPPDLRRSEAMLHAQPINETAPTSLDLGGRTVTIAPASGHTASDVTVDVPDAGVLFCGDLVWNAMFPNYMDAQPAQLATAVRALRRGSKTTYIPGHGAVAGDAEFDRYVAMLDEIERAARAARSKGQSAADAGATYALPASLGEWVLFNKVFFERAFGAWYRVLGG